MTGARAGAALLAVLLTASCESERPGGTQRPPPDEGSPRAGGTAILGSISDVDSWNEYLSAQSFANNLHRRLLLRLAREVPAGPDEPSRYEPELAESWTAAADGLGLAFRLREARWSDGQPVRAEDVRFTWQAQVDPAVAWAGASTKARIVDVRVVDPRTVEFRFDRPGPFHLADAVEGGILPSHVYRPVPFERWRTHDWSAVTVGSGPFLLERHRPGEEIVLRRNPRPAAGAPAHLDRVVVRIVPDVGSLLAQLLAGDLDWVEGIPPREAARVRGAKGPRLIAFDYPMYDYVGWNGGRPPFDDAAVRTAMTLAIDREALVDELLLGYGRVSTGPVLSFWWGADDGARPLPHDPSEARRILESKGFRPGPDGVLARAGRPLAFELSTNLGNRVREEALVKIQAQLARIGVRATPRSFEMATFRTRTMDGQFDAYLGGWRFSGRIDLGSIFGSHAAPPAGNNVVRYRSAQVDALLVELDRALTWRAMKPTLDAIQRRIRADQPYTFLWESRRLAAVSARLRGMEVAVPSDPLAGLAGAWIQGP